MSRITILAAVQLAVVAGGGWYALSRKAAVPDAATAGDIRIPDLSAEARKGEALFNANCATCHGQNATGTENGPPLIHRFYKPDHHADYAFLMAARAGVRAHHWRFGDMPPVAGVTEKDVGLITRYVRELQKANGVF